MSVEAPVQAIDLRRLVGEDLGVPDAPEKIEAGMRMDTISFGIMTGCIRKDRLNSLPSILDKED